jgi:hypothetical protein
LNTPTIYSYNTNKSHNDILGYNPNLSDEKAQWIQAIRDSFKTNLDYKVVTKNLNTAITYDTWIYKSSNSVTQRPNTYLDDRAFLSYAYDTVQFELGDYLNFNLEDNTNSDWIITEINKLQLYDIGGKIERCNTTLSFQIKDGTVVTYPCITDSNNGSLQYLNNGMLTVINSSAVLKLQYNQNTVLLCSGQRIMFSNNEIYKIMDVNTKNCYDSTNGYIIYYLERSVINETTDNLTYKVADYKIITTSSGTTTISYSGKLEACVGGGYKTFKVNMPTGYIPTWTYSSSINAEYDISVIEDSTAQTIRMQLNNNKLLIGSTITLNVTEDSGVYNSSITIPVHSLLS